MQPEIFSEGNIGYNVSRSFMRRMDDERASRPVRTSEDEALFKKIDLTPEDRVRVNVIIKEDYEAALDWEERTGHPSFLIHIDIWPPTDGSKKLPPEFHARWPKVAARHERWWNMTNEDRRKEYPLVFAMLEKKMILKR